MTHKAWHGWRMNEPDDFLTNTSLVLLPKQKSRASKIDTGFFTYTKQENDCSACASLHTSQT
jgi:hypothetical protein